jgi:pyrroloquinoline quinone biosynthesis protein B
MKIIVLGAAAGGGLPQWNCGCDNCRRARAGDIPAQSQSSVAVSAAGRDWAILDASPDIRHQLQAHPALHPDALRQTPIKSVLVTSGDVDHLAGLLSLREGQPFDLFVTRAVADIIDRNPIFGVLGPHVRRHVIVLGQRFALVPGIQACAFAVPGKVPLYMEEDSPLRDTADDHTIGTELVDEGGNRAIYLPGCRALTEAVLGRLEGADALFIDGTLYDDDELRSLGASRKTGRRMGHLPIDGVEGSLVRLAPARAARKIYVHINNTNPIWRQGAERAHVVGMGFEIGFDGMEIDVGAGR